MSEQNNSPQVNSQPVTQDQENATAETSQEVTSKTETTPSEPAVEHEDNLEIQSLRFFARQRAKRAKLKKNMEGMSGFEKFKYIFSYYKWKIIIACIILGVCIALPLTIYKNTRPIAISYVIVNAEDPKAVDTSFVDDYIQTFHIKKPYRTTCDLDVHLDKETYLKEFRQNMNASDYTELPMKCYNGFYDVIIMDKKGMEYCGMQEITYPLKKYLPADIYTLVEDRVVETAGYDGSVVPFAIDISDTDFAKSLNLGYDDVYIGFPGNTDQNYKNAKRMLKYILNLDIDTETTY